EQFLGPFRKTLKIPFRISQPHQRPQYWPFKAIHVSTLRVYSKSTITSISLRLQYEYACTRYSHETRSLQNPASGGFAWHLVLLAPFFGCFQLDDGAVGVGQRQFMTESFPFVDDCLALLLALFREFIN